MVKKIETSFWGSPTYQVKDKDVARFVEVIRSITEKYSEARALRTATAAMHAMAAFIGQRFGLKEVLAILDRLRTEIMGTQV